MSGPITLRPAGPADVALLDSGLRALSEVLGDTHRARAADLQRAAFGPAPVFRAILAEAAGHAPAGLAVYSPLYSTSRGMAGCYVSDLWVAEGLRGRALGPRLLAAVRDEAAGLWGAGFLRLGVYVHTPQARAFYDRLGFAADTGTSYLTLSGAALAALGSAR